MVASLLSAKTESETRISGRHCLHLGSCEDRIVKRLDAGDLREISKNCTQFERRNDFSTAGCASACAPRLHAGRVSPSVRRCRGEAARLKLSRHLPGAQCLITRSSDAVQVAFAISMQAGSARAARSGATPGKVTRCQKPQFREQERPSKDVPRSSLDHVGASDSFSASLSTFIMDDTHIRRT